MKPDYDKIRSVSNLTGERQVMTLDTNATEHLMGLLTDLYSDPQLAVIREYSTNAFDATVDAGSSEPVRVTLPSLMAPNLVIQDFGIGMTTDEVLHVYSQYGNSTKRESNDVVGMLGVGCKSALTYTNSFIISTVKNGVKTVANVTKNTDNVGEIQIIDTASTNERNGTTIQIPVRGGDISDFADKAETFFQYWKPGTVLIDGKAPKFILDVGNYTKVNADHEVYYNNNKGYYSNSVLVMGNVSYPLEISHQMSGANLIVFAPIGAVNFAPSREELSYRGKTDKYVIEIAQVIQDEVNYLIKNAMSHATSKHDAMRIANVMRAARWVPNGVTFTYNGEVVPAWPLTNKQIGTVWNSDKSWNGGNHRIDRDPWHISPEAIIINNGPTSLSAAHKFGLREKFGKAIFFFPTNPITNEWVAPALDWKELRKELPKLESSPSGNGITIDRTSRNYALVNSYGEFTGDYYDDKSKAQYFAFTPTARPAKYDFSTVVGYGLTPIQVYKADFDEFVKNANVWTSIDAFRTAQAKSVSVERMTTMFLDRHYGIHVGVIQKSLDTETQAMLDFTQDITSEEWVLLRNDVPQEAKDAAASIHNLYPLLKAARYGDVRDQVEYVNALYTTRKGN
jgi:Histidine kinase-, DNA gyrase B-, and HSP90-like ATPase